MFEFLKKVINMFDDDTDNSFVVKENKNVSRETLKPYTIKESLSENEEYIKKRFSYPLNNDVIIRKICLRGDRKAILIMYDGMVDTESVDGEIIRSLLEIPYISNDDIKNNSAEIIEKFVSHSQANATENIEDIIDEINFGGCGLFVDGINIGFSMDVRSWEHRPISRPENEQSIYGPQEAFAEMLRANSSLVRKILKTEKLICEGIQIGRVTKTRGVIMYLDNVANDSIVGEVRRRLNLIEADYIFSVEEVSHFIEEKSGMITTQILGTERPDRVARAISEGRVALILSGSPRALIMPTNAFEFLHVVSDSYIRTPYANMSRIVRIIGALISVLLPGLYLAITLYHQEMLPTYLLYSISASRENVPFPSIVEMFLMDFSFELIREAGIRMPSPIGSTLGIVGGIILGQAAVSAKIVSPIMIIIIAITGIGSFSIPDYSLGWSYRVLRVLFIIAGAVSGFLGIATGIFVYSVFLGSQKSFGTPYLSPLPNGGWGELFKKVFVMPIWKNEKRPAYLRPKDKFMQSKISRLWKK